MRSRLGVISILLLLTSQCFAAKCRTCQGKECQKQDIELRECTKFSKILPLETYSLLPKIRDTLQYGCLKLEYPYEKSIGVIEKCVITENLNTLCQNIAKSIPYTTCNVESPIEAIGSNLIRKVSLNSNVDRRVINDESATRETEINTDSQSQLSTASFLANTLIVKTTAENNNRPKTTIYLENELDFSDSYSVDKTTLNNNLPQTTIHTYLIDNLKPDSTISRLPGYLESDSTQASDNVYTTTLSYSESKTIIADSVIDITESQPDVSMDNSITTTKNNFEVELEIDLIKNTPNSSTKEIGYPNSIPIRDRDLNDVSDTFKATSENTFLNSVTELMHTEEVTSGSKDADINTSVAITVNSIALNNETEVSVENLKTSSTTQSFFDFSINKDEASGFHSTVSNLDDYTKFLNPSSKPISETGEDNLNSVLSTDVPFDALDYEQIELTTSEVALVSALTSNNTAHEENSNLGSSTNIPSNALEVELTKSTTPQETDSTLTFFSTSNAVGKENSISASSTNIPSNALDVESIKSTISQEMDGPLISSSTSDALGEENSNSVSSISTNIPFNAQDSEPTEPTTPKPTDSLPLAHTENSISASSTNVPSNALDVESIESTISQEMDGPLISSSTSDAFGEENSNSVTSISTNIPSNAQDSEPTKPTTPKPTDSLPLAHTENSISASSTNVPSNALDVESIESTISQEMDDGPLISSSTSNAVGEENSNSVSSISTNIPSNAQDSEPTKPTTPKPTDSLPLDHTEIPFNLDGNINSSSALRFQISFVTCTVLLFLLYAVTS